MRDRREGDLPALLALLRRTHEQEGYPVRAAAVSADRLDRVAVLLVDPDAPARASYRRRGWQEVGSAVQQWGHRTVDAVCRVPPGS